MSVTLDRLAQQHPEMGAAVRALRAILGALRDCDVVLPRGMPASSAARARLSEGIPALAGEPLLDGDSLLAHAELIATRLAAIDLPESSHVIAALRRARQALDAEALAAIALSGSWDMLAPLAARLDVDEDPLLVLLDYAARPALRAGAAMVAAEISDARWQRGSCPACGAPPLLAELRAASNQSRDEAPRVLRCGRCASAWGVERLRCPACGERDHRKLGYVHVEGEQDYRRIERCESCRSYVKAIAVLAPLDAEALLEEDLATAGLDLIAAERGYHR